MSRTQRSLFTVGAICFALAVGGWLTRPPPLLPLEAQTAKPSGQSHFSTAGLDDYLQDAEARANSDFGITQGAEKRIHWAGEPGVKTDYALVYLHGFSATRQEIAPVPELIANSLGANLFETRLAGHGREREQLSRVPAEAWLADGEEALAVGRALGERVILMGTSTGATIALAMARHPGFAAVDSLVLISPNFGPAAPGSWIATAPYGPQLMRLLAGKTREWQPANELQGRYWTTRYPTAAVVEMMRLVNLAVALTPEAKVPGALLLYSPADDVVSVEKLLAGFATLPALRKQVHRVDQPDSLSAHVLTGDILAPRTSAETAQLISAFLKADFKKKD